MAQTRRILCGYGATILLHRDVHGIFEDPEPYSHKIHISGYSFSPIFASKKKSIENGAMPRRFIVANVSRNMNEACTIIQPVH